MMPITGGVGLGVHVSVAVGGTAVIDGVKVSVGRGVRENSGVAVARGVRVISGASVSVGKVSVACVVSQAANPITNKMPEKANHFRMGCLLRYNSAMLNILIALILSILSGFMPGLQDDFTLFLTPGTSIDLRLDGSDELSVDFEAKAGDVISLQAAAEDADSLDLVLTLIAPDGERLAYNDDWAGGLLSTNGLASELAPSDPALLNLPVWQDGTYTVRLGSFNREQTGDLRLSLRIAAPLTLTIDAPAQTILIQRGNSPRLFLELEAGQSVTLTAADPDGLRDLSLTLLAEDGSRLAFNDDHSWRDVSLNIFDAQLTFTADAAMTVSVQIGEFLGRSVRAQVSVSTTR
jgi:hypothetical protein